jgi:MarR family transcriptional regulator, lower aerobic nicotinate degradation pathway regulator
VAGLTLGTDSTTDPEWLPPELLARSGFLLVRLGVEYRSRAIEELVRVGCGQYHYLVLALLADKPRETQAAMAEALALDPSQLVGILDRLEERGLVERRRDPNDRRRHVVSLTPDGRRQLRRLRSTIDRLEEELLAPLDTQSRERLHALLLRLVTYHEREQ